MKQREQAHLLWSWSRQPPRSPSTAAHRRRAPTIERVAVLCYPGAGWREVIEPCASAVVDEPVDPRPH